jgi:N-acetylneuraminate synthase/sialic acid synthase
MQSIRAKFGVDVGYSDHTLGIEISLAAVALGASVIEKHFTLNRTLKGTDHVFSLEPQGMQKMVRDLNRAVMAIGSGEKVIYEEEIAPIRKMGKMIVAARDLPSGHVITEVDVEFRSPASGLSPANLDKILGKTLKLPVRQYQAITTNEFNL